MSAHYDSIIIGAGAAGLYCAMHAGQRGRRVLVLEHNEDVGAKIIISGGGRCNFTNLHTAPDRFLSANPHFARSALARHTQHDFTALIERHGIAYYEKTLGQLFCEGPRSSRKIVQMLLDEGAKGGVEIRTSCRVTDVRRAERFEIATSQGAFSSDTLVIASGGLSIPKLGATSFAYDIANQFNVPIITPRPGLVPLTARADDYDWMQALAGVSTPISVSCNGATFQESGLFTHRGLSGPAILQVSSYWRPGDTIAIDWAPTSDENFLVKAKRLHPNAFVKTGLTDTLPERLAGALAAQLPGHANVLLLGPAKDVALRVLAQRIKAWRIVPAGTEGYSKAEVTVGGVDTNALSQQTMEVRAAPGLFFIGEAVDVTGWLGGYNFQWAWSSGWAAAQAI